MEAQLLVGISSLGGRALLREISLGSGKEIGLVSLRSLKAGGCAIQLLAARKACMPHILGYVSVQI